MRKVFVLWGLLGLLTLSGYGQVLKPAKWSYAVSKSQISVGDQVDLIFTATIDNDWYMYSSDLDPDLGPTPTTFTFKPNDTYQLVGKIKPIGTKKKYEQIWDGDIIYFTGKAEFRQTVKILNPKPLIEGSYDYQVCTEKDGRCVPLNDDFRFDQTAFQSISEGKKPVETVPSAKGSAAITEPSSASVAAADTAQAGTTARATAGETADATQPAGEKATSATVQSQAASGSADTAGNVADNPWLFLVGAFGAGLLALLTPCVYPMIPFTVSYFTNQSGSRRKGIINAVIYGFSIVSIYTVIGLLVSVLFGADSANALSTHWTFNLFAFVLLVTFGLSFLGLFEIVLPSSLANKADAQAEKGGLTGIFFMAFTLAVVSFSCTGPLAGGLLVAAAQGPSTRAVLGMVAYSSAFALPFTLFAIFPSWLKSLPKSGGWLNSVKVVLGFLELALALKFLSNADQVYHWGILDRDVFLALWIVIFSLIGFYLLGKIRLPHDSEVTTISVPRVVLAIFMFSFVVYIIPGLFGAPLKPLAGLLPPQTTQDFNLAVQGGQPTVATSGGEERPQPKYGNLFKLPHGLQGFFDYKEGMAYAKKVNKPVFIDFTGHGCVNCREMEARVWSDPKVLNRLKNDYVVIALYVDDKYELPQSEWYVSQFDQREKKTIGSQNADLQISRYGNNAQPYYCLLDHQGNLLIQPIAYELDADKFAAFLDSGTARFNNRIAQR